jgi:hypothetical protein
VYLFHKIVLWPHLFDLLELSLYLVDVVIFVLEDLIQQFAGTVVAHLNRQPDALVIALDGNLLGTQVVGVHFGHFGADMDLVEVVHDRMAVQKENTGNQLLGMLHFGLGPFLDHLVQALIAPVAAHLRMDYVLVDNSQLLGQSQIEVLNDLLVSFLVNSPFACNRSAGVLNCSFFGFMISGCLTETIPCLPDH